jgi:uncharacterized protein YecE (DUF72 family)
MFVLRCPHAVAVRAGRTATGRGVPVALFCRMTELRIGTSGWSYPSWRGAFYPVDLPRARELDFASRAFDSLEINRSFYSLLTPSSCRTWRAVTPAGFVFSIKGSSFITHSKKLRDVEVALANFFASGPLALGEKLGPIVWQLPSSMRYDEARLDAFFALLPRSTSAAARLARNHDHRARHGVHTRTARDRKLRHVLEARHDSFYVPECARLLRRHAIALAVSDSPLWSYVEEPTTDFMYLRLHGSTELYTSGYTDAELDHWAARIRAWQEGRAPEGARRIDSTRRKPRRMDVYVYFDNDAAGHAVRDARRLLERLDDGAAARPRARHAS